MAIVPRSYRRDGRRSHPLFETWRAMVRRCHDPKATGYKNYGARGIAVCDRWRNDFWAFVRDVGAKPSEAHTLDRIDNDRGYEPGNVRWATQVEQSRNVRSNHLMTANGRTQTMRAWAEELDMPMSTLFNRLRRGWSDEAAVNTPVQAKAADNSLFPPGGNALVEQLGLNRQTVKSRLLRGWTFEEAIAAPVAHKHRKKRQ